jgi:hypothetical protein
MSGEHINFQSGMRYQIVMHGEEDKDHYSLVDKVIRSPPASPDNAGKGKQANCYRDPSTGRVFSLHTDAQLVLVKVNPTLARSHPKRCLVPSGSRPNKLDSVEPIYIAGTPGEWVPRMDNLLLAWSHPLRNNGSSGLDGAPEALSSASLHF